MNNNNCTHFNNVHKIMRWSVEFILQLKRSTATKMYINNDMELIDITALCLLFASSLLYICLLLMHRLP